MAEAYSELAAHQSMPTPRTLVPGVYVFLTGRPGRAHITKLVALCDEDGRSQEARCRNHGPACLLTLRSTFEESIMAPSQPISLFARTAQDTANTNDILATCISCTVLMFLFLGMRLLSKRIKRSKFDWDDAMLVASAVRQLKIGLLRGLRTNNTSRL